ncbi:hypothetical protein [Bacillus suaedae]|uniref:Uncharacterized protein n=1 Tax=Halalkalibacter suaedae TaxID=2822140 RepID=A0A940WR67_9BACI|nr:hypothetical protein [Bacillus suaedae]MBP3950303.1 hypothetical protein [Bacillus suaedae]
MADIQAKVLKVAFRLKEDSTTTTEEKSMELVSISVQINELMNFDVDG